MRPIPRGLTALVLFSAAASAQTPSIRRLDGSAISVADAESFARKTLVEQHVTGAQIAVLNNGKLAWSASFGFRRKDPELPMDTVTTTWAASLTKSVFATYVMTLVERGEFSLDIPVAQQLAKPLDTYEPYRETATDLVRDPAWATVTPRMLLSHSAGLRNFAWLEPDKKMHLHFKPGTDFLYSGEGINLVQFVVEQKLGKPLDELMQQALFTPLGMKRTGLIYRAEFGDDVADRYDLHEAFISKTQRFPARGAGSMITSAEDLARFLDALMNGRVLKPATMASMTKPQIEIRSLREFPLIPDEDPSNEAKEVGLAYGLGWGLLTKTKFGPAIFKEGHGDGAQNYIICFTRSKTCMVLLTNSDNGELAFRPLLETILGDIVTPWEWEGYTPSYIAISRAQQR